MAFNYFLYFFQPEYCFFIFTGAVEKNTYKGQCFIAQYLGIQYEFRTGNQTRCFQLSQPLVYGLAIL